MRAEQVAAFVDHRLREAERASVEAHLAECADCRAEVVEIERLISGERRRRVRSMVAGGLALAAGAVLVVSVRHRSPGSSDGIARGSNVPSLAAVAPEGGVGRSALSLVWRGAAGVVAYRITLANAAGQTIWTSDRRDTVVAIPDSIALSQGAEYYWTVDAILAQGTSRTTGPQSFRIVR